MLSCINAYFIGKRTTAGKTLQTTWGDGNSY